MRANKVKVGVRVKIIKGSESGQLGTITGVLGELVAVMADSQLANAVGSRISRHYKSGELHVA